MMGNKITEYVGYDQRGMFVGYARIQNNGTWLVNVKGKPSCRTVKKLATALDELWEVSEDVEERTW